MARRVIPLAPWEEEEDEKNVPPAPWETQAAIPPAPWEAETKIPPAPFELETQPTPLQKAAAILSNATKSVLPPGVPAKQPTSIDQFLETVAPPTFKSVNTPMARRAAGDVGAAAAGVVSSTFAFEPAIETTLGIDTPLGRVSQNTAKYWRDFAKEVSPKDANLGDELLQGVTSMATFLVPGLALARAAAVLPRLGVFAAKIAPAVGTSISTILESATEAGETFQAGAEDPKVGKEQAAKNAQKTFWSNVLVIGITNKLGLFGEAASKIKKVLLSAPLEGIQEGSQEIIQSLSQGKPIDWANVAKAAGLGTVIGGGAGLALGGQETRPPESRAGSPIVPPSPGSPPGVPPAGAAPPAPPIPQTRPLATLTEVEKATQSPASGLGIASGGPQGQDAITTAYEVAKQQGSPSELFTFPKESRVEEFRNQLFEGKRVYGQDKVESEVKREYVTKDLGLWKKEFADEVKRKEDGKLLKDTPTLFLDFDELKALNSKVGRQQANQIFKGFARVLNEYGFSAYRWGGDEFAIILNPSKKGGVNPFEVFERSKSLIKDLGNLEVRDEKTGEVIHRGLSISGGFGMNVQEADAAAEVAKAAGKGQIRLDKKFVEAYNQGEGTNYEWPTAEEYVSARAGEALPKSKPSDRGLAGGSPFGSSGLSGPGRSAPGAGRLNQPADSIPVPGPSGDVADVQSQPAEFIQDPDLKIPPKPVPRPDIDRFFREEESREARQKEQLRTDTARIVESLQNEVDAVVLLQKEAGSALASSPVFNRNYVRERIAEIRTGLKRFIQDRVPQNQQGALISAVNAASTPQALKMILSRTESAITPKTATTQQIVKRTTGQDPDRTQIKIREDVALKNQIQAEARGSRAGFKVGVQEGSQFTKEEMMQRFREGRQQIQDTIEFIKNSLPVEERGRFMSAAAKAQTLRRHYSIFARVVERLEQIKAGELRSEIKDFVKPSDKIPVDYQRRLEEIGQGIDLKKPTDAMMTKLKGLRDFIAKNGEPLGINPKKIEALKRLTKKSVKNMTTDELTELRDELKSLQELGRLKLDLKWKYNMREWRKETQKLVASTVNIDPIATGNEKLDKAKAQTIQLYMDTMHTMRVADMIDGYKNYKGENVKHLKDLAQREDSSVLEHRNKMADFMERGQKIKANWSQDEMDAMAFHIYKEQKAFEQAQTLIDTKGWNSEPKITPEMRKMIDLMREVVDKNAAKIAAVYEEIQNQPFQKVKNYFPIKYEKEFNLVSPATIEQNRYRTTQAFKGFTFERKPGVKKMPRTDLFNVVDEAISEQEWYVNMQPKLENLKYLVKSEEYGKAAGEVAQNFWKNMLDIVARRGWSATAKSSFLLREGRINLQKAVLGYKLSSILMQPMAIFDALAFTSARFDPKTSFEVAKQFAKAWLVPGYAKEFISQSPALKARAGGEEAIAETFEAAKRSSHFYRVYIEKGMGLLQKADVTTAAGIERGVFNSLVRNGVPTVEAKAEADFIMILVSGSNNVVYRPQILSQGEGARAWFTFQNFFLNRWGIVAHDLIQSGLVKGTYVQKISALVGLGILMAGSYAEEEARRNIYQLVTGKKRKPTSAALSALMTVPTAIPFFGNLIDAAYNEATGGRGRTLPPLLQTLYDGVKGTVQAVAGKKKRTRIRGALQAVETPLAIGLGIPGTSQAFDLLERVLAR